MSVAMNVTITNMSGRQAVDGEAELKRGAAVGVGQPGRTDADQLEAGPSSCSAFVLRQASVGGCPA